MMVIVIHDKHKATVLGMEVLGIIHVSSNFPRKEPIQLEF
jgi:hypothetical protein